jgi:sugar-phosphatase
MTAAIRELACAAVLFDLDGVLVDSAGVVERSWRRWARRHGLVESEVLRLCHGRPSAETIAAAAAHLDATAEATWLEQEQAAAATDVTVCSGAGDIVSALPFRSWAVVTSGGRALAESRLIAAGLPLPEVLVTADDVKRGKPDPEGYLAAAERLAVRPDTCVVIEDARPGVLAARAAGCRVIGIAGHLLGATDDVELTIDNLSGLAASTTDAGIVLRRRDRG